jgi:hypothetical protein
MRKLIEYHCELTEGNNMNKRANRLFASIFTGILSLPGGALFAQDAADSEDEATVTEEPALPQQDDVSKALDSTATQWSFQFAYQSTSWKDDIVNGEPRRPGLDNFVQMRVVAPFVFDTFTLLPRLTLRHYENEQNGESGLGNTELFGLIIPKKWDWGSGRGVWTGRRDRKRVRQLVLRSFTDPVLAGHRSRQPAGRQQ